MKSLNYLNKFKNFKKLDKIFRVRSTLDRHNKIRLDKNERPSDFESSFIKKIKSKINSNYLNAYPLIRLLYNKIN